MNILYIGNKLMKHGHSATSIETLGPLLEEEGYELEYSSDKKYQIFRLFDILFSVVKYSRKVNYILIDTYSRRSFYGTLIITVLCRLLQLKYILILHGGNLPLRLKNNVLLSNIIFKNAYKLVAPSGYLKTEFVKYGYDPVLIPNNIEISEYKFLQRKYISPKLLFVRSFASIYNPQMAVEVLNLLVKNYPDAELCMVGPDKDGTLEKCKKMVSAYKLNDKVIFTGVLSKKEWFKLSESYDIFINTTNVDNTPVSVIEAMALGLPVVSTNVGGLPFLLTHEKNALLVNKNDIRGMVVAIKRLLKDEQLAGRLSENGRKKAEIFDWEHVKPLWDDLLKKEIS